MSTTDGAFKYQSWNKMSVLVTRGGQVKLDEQEFIEVTKAQLQGS